MFYKINKIVKVCICANFLAFNAFSQELELFSEDTLIAPPKKEDAQLNLPSKKSLDDNSNPKQAMVPPIKMPTTKGPIPKTAIEKPTGVVSPKFPVKTPPAPKKIENIKNDSETEDLLKEYGDNFDDSIFTQMSEIEKESTLLTLRLKKEQIKNDLEAIKQKRIDAVNQEKEKKEALLEKKRDEDREKQKELLKEQQALKDKEIAFEKLRQEDLLNDYKEAMLKEKQDLLKSKSNIYVQLKEAKEETSSILQNTKDKFSQLISQTDKIKANALQAKTRKDAEISNLKTQISTLQAQLDAQIEAQKEAAKEAQNPFKNNNEDGLIANREIGGTPSANLSLESEYAIVEIRGKNNKLIAKLLNKNGKTFLAQVGTYLQTGHIVEDITETYIKANKEGKKEYIYFAAGGILEKEPAPENLVEEAVERKSNTSTPAPQATKPTRRFNVYSG